MLTTSQSTCLWTSKCVYCLFCFYSMLMNIILWSRRTEHSWINDTMFMNQWSQIISWISEFTRCPWISGCTWVRVVMLLQNVNVPAWASITFYTHLHMHIMFTHFFEPSKWILSLHLHSVHEPAYIMSSFTFKKSHVFPSKHNVHASSCIHLIFM